MTEPLKLQIARLTWEASAPLGVGAGAPDELYDLTLARDANGLPILPATSLVGALRAALYDGSAQASEEERRLFGDRSDRRGPEGSAPGALLFTEALSLNGAGRLAEGLADEEELAKDPLFALLLQAQPIQRDHVRLNAQSSVDGSGKFTRAAVPRGTRFYGAIECWGEDALWEEFLKRLEAVSLRLGGATRSGYGALRLISLERRSFDLRQAGDRKEARRVVSLAEPLRGAAHAPKAQDLGFAYRLSLTPEEPFRFGQGASRKGDEDPADLRPLRETAILWEPKGARIEEEAFFIPISAVKGALRHRTAFHLRRFAGVFEADPREGDGLEALFGTASANAEGGGRAGALIFEDLRGEAPQSRRIARTSIDRFTGGVRRGALFTEEVDETNQRFLLTIRWARGRTAQEIAPNIAKAFEAALEDLARGWLALGASGSKGLGVFRGKLEKKDEP